MFYEWSSRYIQREKYFSNKYQIQKGNILYYPYIKNDELHLQKVQVECIEWDDNAPEYRFESPKAICNISKIKFLGGKKWVEVPLWLCSKDKMTARGIFVKYSKYLEQIKIRKTKEK